MTTSIQLMYHSELSSTVFYQIVFIYLKLTSFPQCIFKTHSPKLHYDTRTLSIYCMFTMFLTSVRNNPSILAR